MKELDWLHPYLSMTLNLYLCICDALTSTASLRDIARKYHVPDHTVTAVLKSVPFGLPYELPYVFCIDEFHGSTSVWDSENSRWIADRFHCNIPDGHLDNVVDVLPRIGLPYLKEYFSQFEPRQLASADISALICTVALSALSTISSLKLLLFAE